MLENENVYMTNMDNKEINTKTPKKKTSKFTILIRIILFIIIILLLYLLFTGKIKTFIHEKFIESNIKISTLSPNEYYREYDYNYVQITDDFIAKDKQHLLNIYYTIVNSGADEFTFRCDEEYSSCIEDVEVLSNSQLTLSNINSFVHPFNSFHSIETQYDTLGKVVIKINKSYTDEEIRQIEVKVNNIIDKQIKNEKDVKTALKLIHNYIINNSKYDINRSENGIVNYKSEIAYGPLIQGYSLCGGYTDAMALFLDYYDLNNYKVISENHTWNAVYLDGKWYHIDLTWDDPVSTSGKDILDNRFFLITSKELENLEVEQHNYDKNIFKELD